MKNNVKYLVTGTAGFLKTDKYKPECLLRCSAVCLTGM